WCGLLGWRGYLALRTIVVGLDYLVASLALFLVAAFISLLKSGYLSRWIVIGRSESSEAPPASG
ncbi:MAG: hypothetical protein AB7K24_24255, partial [Gemmataceae bacterium]